MTGGIVGTKAGTVQTLRRLAFANRMLMGVALALALAMKLLLPAGFMPVRSADGIVISICSGTGSTSVVMSIPRQLHGDTGDGEHHSQDRSPCAFAGLSLSSLAAADPVLLAAALLFVMALAQQTLAPPETRAPPHLRPPLRGPPAKA